MNVVELRKKQRTRLLPQVILRRDAEGELQIVIQGNMELWDRLHLGWDLRSAAHRFASAQEAELDELFETVKRKHRVARARKAIKVVRPEV